MSTIKVKTDYIRSMTENIEDGISRPLDFYHLDGDISFQADGVNSTSLSMMNLMTNCHLIVCARLFTPAMGWLLNYRIMR